MVLDADGAEWHHARRWDMCMAKRIPQRDVELCVVVRVVNDDARRCVVTVGRCL